MYQIYLKLDNNISFYSIIVDIHHFCLHNIILIFNFINNILLSIDYAILA